MPAGASFDGYPSRGELESSPGYPSRRRMESGPVAIIECVQEIPCNPCETACPRHAIRVGEPITSLPVLDEDKCTGCGLCVPACPGLAIFRLHLHYRPGLATVDFPYEYLPLPEVDTEVDAVGRDGGVLCRGRVVAVQAGQKTGGTAVVRLAVPAEFAEEVRSMSGGLEHER